MKKLIFCGILATCVVSSASAGNRQVRTSGFQHMQAPRYIAPIARTELPRWRPNEANRHIVPASPRYEGHLGNVERHNPGMIMGPFGWHPPRNRTPMIRIFGGMTDSEQAQTGMDPEQYIDSIDVAAPLIPLSEPCGGSACTNFGAMSIANNGSFGAGWNYPDASAALVSAYNGCMSTATSACISLAISGAQWAAGIICNNGQLVQGTIAPGDDQGSAITNAYRRMAGKGIFNVLNDCSLIALIAADGAQNVPLESSE